MSRAGKIKHEFTLGEFSYLVHTLSNGIRIVFAPNRSPITYTAFFINAGSRDELSHEHGLAHLIEHMIFKGTIRRKAHHIIGRMENVGGELNAYTTKEETCIHATFLNDYLERAWELMADIIFHATFPENELEKEKSVIIDEINSFRDNPAEVIFDDFDQRLFESSALGRNILGTPETLLKLERSHLLHFIERNYHTDQMVVSVVGNYSFDKLKRLAQKYFEGYPARLRDFSREKPPASPLFQVQLQKNLNQTHCVIGTQAYGFNNPRRLTLLLLNDILGGPGMNSRLNVELRERRACAYNIESSYVSYSDTGIFSVYFGCDARKLDKCLTLIHKELTQFRTKRMSDLRLHLAKRQLMGQLAISVENNENLLMALGKSILVYNHFDILAEVVQKLDNIDASMLLDVANEIFDPQRLSTLIYK
ncbi:MAG: M16 family metallopeptidase [Bacteroidales bacterium]